MQTHGQSQSFIPLNFFKMVELEMLDGQTPEDARTISSHNKPKGTGEQKSFIYCHFVENYI